MPPYPIEAPVSASLRCLKALRYFVRSYVTRPTTISAITEIPANTPSPIGKTCSFFPGNANDVDDAFAAAAVPVAVAERFPLVLAAADDEGVDGDGDVDDAAEVGVDVGGGDVVDAGEDDVSVIVDAVGADGDEGTGEGGTVDRPSTDTAGPVAVAASPVAVGGGGPVGVPLGGGASVAVSGGAPPVATVIAHDFTSMTMSWPLESLDGVRVMVHVSVTVPAGVSVVCVVCIVVAPSTAAFCRRISEASAPIMP